MKEYMRKRRAEEMTDSTPEMPDECRGCDIFCKYCDGPARSIVYRCRLEVVPPQTEKEQNIHGKARYERLTPIFVPDDTAGIVNKIREITGEPAELIMNRLAYAELKTLRKK